MLVQPVRLIVAGGRDFTNYQHAEQNLLYVLQYIDLKTVEIVCGGARGADMLGKLFALKYNLPIKLFIPDWNGLGKKAGFMRNREMAEYGTHLVAFWDSKSRGTANMLQEAKNKDLPTRCFYYNLGV